MGALKAHNFSAQAWVTVTKQIGSLGNNRTMRGIGFDGVCRFLSGNHPLVRSVVIQGRRRGRQPWAGMYSPFRTSRKNGEVAHQLIKASIPYPNLLGAPLSVVGLGLQIISPYIFETLHL
jgi:hypothetical protein